MPFKSEAQRRWMYANEPEMAKKWQKHTPKSKLPEKLHKKAVADLGNRIKVMLIKKAVQQVAQQLIPGAPPVPRIQPAGGQQPAAAPTAPAAPAPQGTQPAASTPVAPQPAANGVPQAPTAATPTLPTAKDVMKKTPTALPGAPLDALSNSESIIGNKLSKMSSIVTSSIKTALRR